jgi:ArsR family transcriptional regulator
VEINVAVQRLGALAHDTRLSIFRLLVRRGGAGLAAGEIASRLEIAAPNASFHLAELSRVGLLAGRRDGRNIIYTVDFSAMSALVDYLREHCCDEETPPIIPIKTIARRRKNANP